MLNRKEKQSLLLSSLKIILLILNTAVFCWFWFCFYEANLYTPFFQRGNYVMFILFFIINAYTVRIYGGFDLKTSRVSELIYSHIVSLLMTGFFLYIVIWILTRHLPNPLPLLGCLLACSLVDALWSKLTNKLFNHLYPPFDTVILYDHEEAYLNGKHITEKVSWRFKIVDEISVNRGLAYILDWLAEHQPTAVLLCGINSSQRNDILKYCIENDIVAYIRPNIADFLINGSQKIQVANLPVFMSQRAAPNIFYSFIKRFFDILLSLVGLIVTSPITIITAIIIKAYDRGPVFYKQTRLTKDRKEFEVYKFRSMKTDAESDGVARLASQNDNRITPIGNIIRKCRIDELPQLFNILFGTMTIVGPRPERPELAEKNEKEMPEFSLRLHVKAGLTGYAQVHGKYNTSPYDKLQMDLMYVSQLRVITDLKIILATIKILFMPESTEGVKESQTTVCNEKVIKN